MVNLLPLCQEKPLEVSCSAAAGKVGNCNPESAVWLLLLKCFQNLRPFLDLRVIGKANQEGQASQKSSGANRKGTSWWNSSILLTYDDMIDFPSECSNVGLSSYHPPISSSIPASICPPTRQHQRLMDKASVCLRHWRRGWRVEEQLRRMKGEIWECNFPSVNLPSREQVDHQSGGVDSEGRHLTGARWVTASCHYINTAMRDIKKGFFFLSRPVSYLDSEFFNF